MSTRASLDPATADALRELTDLSLSLICIVDTDGFFRYVNPVWVPTLGYSVDELFSRPYIEIIHPDDRAATKAEADRVASGHSTISFENRLRCKDGSYRSVLWSAIVRPDTGLLYCIASDVTEQKREEARLAAQHAITRVLAEAETLAGATPRILEAACKSLGWSFGAIFRLNPADDVLRCVQCWHAASADIGPFEQGTMAATFPRGIGLPGRVWAQARPVWIEDVACDPNFPRAELAAGAGLHAAFGFPILLGSEVLGVLEFFSDRIQQPDSRLLEMMGAIGSQIGQFIERKEAEDALRVYARDLEVARRRAEEATRAKSDFLANMSHEIRTPMNAMIGMTELALSTKLTRDQREYLNAIQASANTLLALINDLLDFSKIEARKLKLDRVGFGLRDVLEDTMRVLAPRAHQKGIELACHIRPEVDDDLVGDPLRLRQIVVNLVGNAIKFTEHGEVVLHVESEGHENGRAHLQFSVTDTGIGIPADKQALIFEAFSQADSSTTRRYGGTGLGLAISAQLVAMMDGRIWVESEPDRGSTFHFTVWLESQQPGAKEKPARWDTLTGLSVLIVDDNATNRRILEEVLTNWRMRPMAVDSGKAALAMLKKAASAGQPFAVLLLDGHMPEMDGFTVAESIARERHLAELKVIMLTSAGRPEDAERCRKLGISAYLTKPIKQSELFDVIISAIGQAAFEESHAQPRKAGRKRGRALRVLLAEDNQVNQLVATRLLERLGHHVTVVGDGSQAVAALASASFDLVAMDVQMPVMDGLAATQEIRAREQASGAHIPIIAMTAHAMKGDRERCVAAGMDGYVSKPIRMKELEEAISEAIGPRTSPSAPGARAAEGSPVDRDALLQNVGGDERFLGQLIRLFLADAPKRLAEIKSAIRQDDATALERAAHALKGSAGNFGATQVVGAAAKLEAAGRVGDLSRANEDCDALTSEIDRLTSALEAMVSKPRSTRRRRA